MPIGDPSKPASSIQGIPVISPLPLKLNQPQAT
jgi:hypothetical protein